MTHIVITIDDVDRDVAIAVIGDKLEPHQCCDGGVGVSIECDHQLSPDGPKTPAEELLFKLVKLLTDPEWMNSGGDTKSTFLPIHVTMPKGGMH